MLLDTLDQVYIVVTREYNFPIGDMPPIKNIKSRLEALDWTKLPKLDDKRINSINDCISVQIPQIMALIPKEENISELIQSESGTIVESSTSSPFLVVKGVKSGTITPAILEKVPSVDLYKNDFISLGPDSTGRVSGEKVRQDFFKSKLPNTILHRVWNLSDFNEDGYLNLEEYTVARLLIELKLAGHDLPTTLPRCYKYFLSGKTSDL